ncbi:hypothetical protein F0562_022754 [Nyssa sinensis]|uniref:Uncharacterized protein n=1 Tax=Nyssa sinensis TaxID=561372 RepID=A0A5J5BIN1_9ASTE|nr:hypothetical protein F0562_022754 [Nyssa sinensis]
MKLIFDYNRTRSFASISPNFLSLKSFNFQSRLLDNLYDSSWTVGLGGVIRGIIVNLLVLSRCCLCFANICSSRH